MQRRCTHTLVVCTQKKSLGTRLWREPSSYNPFCACTSALALSASTRPYLLLSEAHCIYTIQYQHLNVSEDMPTCE